MSEPGSSTVSMVVSSQATRSSVDAISSVCPEFSKLRINKQRKTLNLFDNFK
ncbi:MAG: hypothetical protein O3B82_05250 [Bacteroidetes bacterium]|nr:hypothetical protein [Bacteroidota bacterium]